MRRTANLRLGILLSTLLLAGCSYNTLVSMREAIDAAWAQVENQLQRRNDLIPNLVEVTKGYATHEKEIFESVANARSKLLAAGTRDEKIDAANNLSGALGRLLAIAERYPDLKANVQFAKLSDELAGTENRIAVERMRYNDAVRAFNTAIKSFPTVAWAGWLGFETQKYFEAPAAAKEVPKVDFGAQPKPQ
ncbi:MAG TPA: LemA family protein [Candidatus Eisenbacteria bacterium]|nr:LemA family protein [Candidatus Eisenbacteria bacterium]